MCPRLTATKQLWGSTNSLLGNQILISTQHNEVSPILVGGCNVVCVEADQPTMS